jgi:hypothetical protein
MADREFILSEDREVFFPNGFVSNYFFRETNESVLRCIASVRTSGEIANGF